MPDVSLAGIKAVTAVAGFIGAVASLSAIKPLTRTQAVLAVLTGAAVAGYLTPVAAHYADLNEELQNGVAFVLGLTSMHIVPGLLRLGEMFRNDPMSFFRREGGDK